MAGIVTAESEEGRSLEGVLSCQQQQCQSGEALAEWRSSEQVENGIPSTSPPYWDSDSDDDNGPRPSELYGKYTWKISKFSQINKRELRSDVFEAGSYKWYILIYPQGCDVCNHLSLFLCVANHDKLLPGWSHFAQFTIAVVNKDAKKSKYSDTLHRFWKKEHDWGWKKFMELSKLLDGFIDADTLIIKAQVQVIRERTDYPFRCLDIQYRRELVRVYLTNVEQICRRFVEERRSKLGKLIEDKARWSSFRTFWMGIDQSVRHHMSRERTDSILKVLVKHFFIEKEVTSTLVMDSLYSGLKALEGQTKGNKVKGKYLEAEELPVPIVRIEKDMFVLVDDVLLLLERAAMEPLPPKDEKGPQNRIKDGSAGEEFNKDLIERDERRLTELGRRTIEIFILAHLFSKIEVAYQEAVALKRQEELIREEEAAWMAENEQKGKRGAADKEKKSKKKQGKQKRNSRKAKDKGRDDKPDIVLQGKTGPDTPTGERNSKVVQKSDALEDVSDVSDSVDCVPEVLPPDSEERAVSPINRDNDTAEMHPPAEASSSVIDGISSVQNGIAGRTPSVVDDNSSTFSTDSVPSVVVNVPYKGNPPNLRHKKSLSRVRNHRGTAFDADLANETPSQSFESGSVSGQQSDPTGAISGSVSQTVVPSFQDRVSWPKCHVGKEEVIVSPQRNLSAKDVARAEASTEKTAGVISSPRSSSKNIPSTALPKSETKISAACNQVMVKKPSPDSTKDAGRPLRLETIAANAVPWKPGAQKVATLKLVDKPSGQQVPAASEKPSGQQVPATTDKPSMQQVLVTNEKLSKPKIPVVSRPLSAPLTPGPRATVSMAPMVQTTPFLARSSSAAGRLGPDPSSETQTYVQQSYRNAMMGNSVAGSSPAYKQHHAPASVVNPSYSYSQAPAVISPPLFPPQSPDRMEPNSVTTSSPFVMVNHEMLQNGSTWMESSQRDSSRKIPDHHSSVLNEMKSSAVYAPPMSRFQDHNPSESLALTSGPQSHGAFADEFPHLDIINELLDDEQGYGIFDGENLGYRSFSNGPHHLNQQFSFQSEMGMSSVLGPSTSSCKFERTRSSHDDEFLHGYGASGSHLDTLGNMIPQSSSQPYVNGQIDGLIPNQWQMAGSDLPLNVRNMDSDGYPHYIPEYPNLAHGINGYTVFQPSSRR
ncbi:MATH domain-containing protein At5g43560-like isoform X2 [Olea europaea var. sylvestris]|uniref:MATH domain-containing protein At5g43560-like isoform X2 n=1 Tax=Olea europaea var. sylvestris TaxID=158386 RepID=UPI000C1CF9B0|nr:MATH domain-containing protein At5g43560-like isoform X2 [Olea europaea var. sylvestris]